mmetsp:Transcript_26383/g.42760  ORF Transcript_26383/g.42760 Transcript_26383/m.42760 type:complete len:1559 (+) Transcript_26383:78-4754(+)|eukprot:CAMPEP_0203753490 /NCGR_PEP_ID=MMETSP0098-20131031/7254_1 /ASSEMBLY_ACC=CAM_ASM_000208 /TAXON_ID=96639 /ORGANISM=" , Strain NY0313808BC1" /LENGTH=1558 /DNA_ID=CAMNT_0050644113 /DNA_START=35 /DNA_END=4711 /DNA_ORIENTATION=-
MIRQPEGDGQCPSKLKIADELDEKADGILRQGTHKNGSGVVSWEDLTVHVPRLNRNCLHFLTSPTRNMLREYFGMSIETRQGFNVFEEVSGYLKVGETCLLLGPPGSGKSTLLRALSGRLNPSDELSGTIITDGVQVSRDTAAYRRHCNYVSDRDDNHAPQLTVRETFTFAAASAQSFETSEMLHEQVDKVLESLGLSHVADTVVGDEELRGLSGGQKRRVTVGEILFNKRAPFLFMDNITNGLDSASSLVLLETIQKLCKNERFGAMVSLLQPSDQMVEMFDKVLVLTDEGKMAYFGPSNTASIRAHFGSGCDSTLCETVLKACTGAGAQVSTAEFEHSDFKNDLLAELSSIRENSVPDTLPEEMFANGFFKQFSLNCGRRRKLIFRNAMTYVRVLIAIVYGCIVGSLFTGLPLDSMGALGTNGFIFLSLFIVLMLSSAVTLPQTFRARETYYKHRSLAFYSPYSYYLAIILMDLPLSILEAVIISVIEWFWVGLHGNFFYYFVVLFALECCGQSLTRFVCSLVPTQVLGNVCITTFLAGCGALCGFMPSYTGIPVWFRWINWIVPTSYAFEGLMFNQYRSINVSLIGSFGSQSGLEYLEHQDVPRVPGLFPNSDSYLIFDCCMLFVFAIVFDLQGLFGMEKGRKWYSLRTRRPQAVVATSAFASKHLSETSVEKEDDSSKVAVPMPQQAARGSLIVRDLCYVVKTGKSGLAPSQLTCQSMFGKSCVKMAGKEVPVAAEESPGSLMLLNNVSVRFSSGSMTALMGESGAGKTTLMDVIAGYKTGGVITGQVLVNGQLKDSAKWKRQSGYAEQNDIFNPYLSVEETLRFTAKCRLPSGVDSEAVVVQIMHLMGLVPYASMCVGRERADEGLSKHVRKRLTIATELVGRPGILFLDEPTTGLDSVSSKSIMQAIRQTCDVLGLIVVATIHQPSREIFESFDNLVLLGKGGNLAYSGAIGPASRDVLEYFANESPVAYEESTNPADYILHAVDEMSRSETSAPVAWLTSSQGQQETREISADFELISSCRDAESVEKVSYPGFFTQYGLLVKRQFLCEWRNPTFTTMRLMCSVFGGIFLGLLFFNLGNDLDGAILAVAAVFYSVFLFVTPMQASVVPLIEDRAVLYRETVSGTYSHFAYGFAHLTANIPFHVLNAVLFFACFYFLTGLGRTSDQMGYFVLLLFLVNWVLVTLGQLFAYFSPNIETANGLAGLSIMLSVLLMGFLITKNAMPDYWTWAYEANLLRYILQGFVTNELATKTFYIDLGLGGAANGASALVAANSSFLAGVSTNDLAFTAADMAVGQLDLGLGNITFPPIPDENNTAFVEWLSECVLSSDPPSDMVCQIKLLAATGQMLTAAACLNMSIEQLLEMLKNNDFGPLVKQILENLFTGKNLEMVFCISNALLPPSWAKFVNETIVNLIKELASLALEILTEIILKLTPLIQALLLAIQYILQHGLPIPGGVILLYFGWAKLEGLGPVIAMIQQIIEIINNIGNDKSIIGLITALLDILNIDILGILSGLAVDASFKWYYCMFAVAMFIIGLEVLKLFTLRTICWVKR